MHDRGRAHAHNSREEASKPGTVDVYPAREAPPGNDRLRDAVKVGLQPRADASAGSALAASRWR